MNAESYTHNGAWDRVWVQGLVNQVRAAVDTITLRVSSCEVSEELPRGRSSQSQGRGKPFCVHWAMKMRVGIGY